MKQKIKITISMQLDEETATDNLEYAMHIANEMLGIAKQDDCNADLAVEFK